MTSLTDNESDVFASEFNWTISTSSQLWNIKGIMLERILIYKLVFSYYKN